MDLEHVTAGLSEKVFLSDLSVYRGFEFAGFFQTDSDRLRRINHARNFYASYTTRFLPLCRRFKKLDHASNGAMCSMGRKKLRNWALYARMAHVEARCPEAQHVWTGIFRDRYQQKNERLESLCVAYSRSISIARTDHRFLPSAVLSETR